MSFISFRRYFLDQKLSQRVPTFSGKILDLGGQKEKRRGRFVVPEDLKDSWIVLNNNKDVNPDILGSLPDINVEDKSVDVILMTEVAEYIYNYDKLLDEMVRVLKDEGNIFFSVPFLNPLHGDSESDYYRFTEVFWQKVLGEKFNIITIERMGSLASVCSDFILTYYQRHPSFLGKAISKLIRIFFSLILKIDKHLFSNNFHINTGFWIELEKKN